MSIVTARIPDSLNEALSSVAKTMERSKAFIIQKAIENYVMELQEDIEDYNDAMEILAQNNKSIPWEEVMRNCGLEN